MSDKPRITICMGSSCFARGPVVLVDGKASVIPESCVACVKVCPAHAKKIRSDLARLKEMLVSGEPLYASVAEKGVKPNGDEAELALGPAEEGRFYSVEGGMNDTLRDGRTDVRYVSVSGLEDFAGCWRISIRRNSSCTPRSSSESCSLKSWRAQAGARTALARL